MNDTKLVELSALEMEAINGGKKGNHGNILVVKVEIDRSESWSFDGNKFIIAWNNFNSTETPPVMQ